MGTTGVMESDAGYERMARKRIEKSAARDVLDGFYDYVLINKSYSSAYMYLARVDDFLKEMGVKDTSKIKLNDYTRFLTKKKSKTSSYQIAVYSALKCFSKYLKATGICEKDHMEFVDRPKFRETQETKDRRERGFLNKTEIKDIIKAIDEEWDGWKAVRNRAIVMIFLNTGIRRAAMFKLDVNDVDLDNNVINVMEKGGVYRKVYISANTADAIREWLVVRKRILGVAAVSCSALIVSEERERLSCQSIYNIIKRAGKRIAGKEISPHKLRATFGTQLYEATQNVYLVQHRMGHASPQTTERYIRGRQEEEARRAAEIMGEML